MNTADSWRTGREVEQAESGRADWLDRTRPAAAEGAERACERSRGRLMRTEEEEERADRNRNRSRLAGRETRVESVCAPNLQLPSL